MDPYTHQEIKQPRNRKKLIAIIAASVGGLLLIASAMTFALYLINHQKLVDEVKIELRKVPAIMDNAKKDSGSYPATITSKLLPDTARVSLVGIGSFDGTIYCVTGTSKIDTSIIFHIDPSSARNGPQAGSCTDAANLPEPTVPAELLIDSSGTDQIEASWHAATFAGSYTLECSPTADFSASVISKIYTKTIGICSNLKSSTVYYVRVRGNNTSQAGTWSTAITFKTAEMSVAPADLTGKRISTSSVGYSWSAVSGAKSYVVERALDINFMKNVVDETVSGTETSAVFTGLQPNTAYFIHVKAVTADFDASRAAFSNEIQVRTLAN